MFEDFFNSFDLGDYSSWIGPAISGAAAIGGGMVQADQMKDIAKKQSKSYKDYLSAINPPDSVKEVNFNQLKDQVMSQAPVARRRLEDSLASRGIRGAGGAAPLGNQDAQIQKALNDAYFKVYGSYNVPNTMAPTSGTPNAGQIMGMNAGQVGSYLLPEQLSKLLKPSKAMQLNYNNTDGADPTNRLEYWGDSIGF